MAQNTKPRYDDLEEEDSEEHSVDYVAKLNELLERAEPTIYQVNASYNQYVAGIEVKPPKERHAMLDQMMSSLMMMAKPTAAYRFRYQKVLATYHTYSAKWAKMLQDLESGKIKRFAGPGRYKKTG